MKKINKNKHDIIVDNTSLLINQKKVHSKRKKKISLINKNKTKFIKKIVIIILSSIILFAFHYIPYIKKETENYNLTENEINNNKFKEGNNIEEIYKDTNLTFDSITDSFNKAKPFLKNAMEGKYIQDRSKFELSENPMVSLIIPVYNCNYYISRAIKSAQNQNLLDIEIILIDDFSTDGTLSKILIIQKEDPRIKLIINKKNMGILYSRSIGVLSSKGKYIFCLDNDDMLLNEDVFKTITDIAEKGNIDITEFRGALSIYGENFLSHRVENINFSFHKKNIIMKQPTLGDYPIYADEHTYYGLRDVYLWNKCIKSEIYKKALNYLGEKRYSRFMLSHEDVIIIFVLFNIAESFIFVGKYGIFRELRNKSASSIKNELVYALKDVYFTEVVINFSKNTIEQTKLIYKLMMKLLGLRLLELIWKNEENREIIISCLDKVLKSNMLNEEYKNNIRNKVAKVSFIDYTKY